MLAQKCLRWGKILSGTIRQMVSEQSMVRSGCVRMCQGRMHLGILSPLHPKVPLPMASTQSIVLTSEGCPSPMFMPPPYTLPGLTA